MLINASEKFKPLKKNKGSKRKEIDEASRLEIVETLARFVDNDYARVFDKEFFYFNKQGIMLTNVDEQGRSFASHLKDGKTSLKLSPIALDNGVRSLTEFTITDSDDLLAFYEQDIKPFIDSLDYKDQPLVVTTDKAIYSFDSDRETIIKQSGAKREELGCGKFVVKAAFKKATKTQAERIEITVELTPDYQKDYEIIPFHRDEVANREAIAAFMAKYITKPFEYLENVVGVEINFNKVFYKPEKLRSVEEILGEIASLDQELQELDENKRLANIRKHGFDFADISSIFDSDTVTVEDDRYNYGEQRFMTLAFLQGRIIAVVHTENDDLVRIISVRKASKYEQQIYFDQI
jgi:type I restriction enzyme M protein